jgi:hypothetical protein
VINRKYDHIFVYYKQTNKQTSQVLDLLVTVNTTNNWFYNDMFRLTRVIVKLRSEPLNVFKEYVYFGIPKCIVIEHIQRFCTYPDGNQYTQYININTTDGHAQN